MGSKRSEWRLLRWFRGKLLVLLLVGALLACHGVFGTLHLCSAAPPTGSVAHHALHDHTSQGVLASTYEHQACHLIHADSYYAVLLTALFGLALGLLLLKGTRVWSRIAMPQAVFQSFRLAALYPPRFSTNPLVLQVMRP